MSLSPMEEAFIKSGLVSKEKLEKREQDRIKAQKEATKRCEKAHAKLKEELKNSDVKTLTPTQIENWRRVLCGMIGPYALIMPVEDIQKFRDKMQKDVYRLDETLKKEGKNTQHEED